MFARVSGARGDAARADTTFTVDLSDASTKSRFRAYNRFVDDSNYDLIEFQPGATKATIKRGGLWWHNTLGTVTVPTTGAFKVRYSTSQNWISAKVWPAGQDEPAGWDVTYNDWLPFFWGTPKWVLTGGTGAAGSVRVDDLSVASAGTDTLAAYEWDGDGHLTKETLPGGVTRNWAWVQGQLVSYNQSGSGLNRSTSLAYDSAGRVASEATGGAVTAYGYDPAGQLTTVDTPGATADVTYAYDTLGRRTNQNTSTSTISYGYDLAGQLVSATPGTGTPTVYAYDGAGRRTSETTGTTTDRVFGYDPAGSLVSTTSGGATVARSLDPMGQPETITGPDGVTRADWTPDGELVSLTRPDAGIATLTRPAPGSAWSTITQGTAHLALSTDIHRSTLGVNRVATADTYNEFGQPAGTPTPDTTSIGYRGELTIAGLTHLRARDYDPTTGQFTTTDPIAAIPGASAAANPYAYVNNSPLNYTDPSGLISIPDTFSVLEFAVKNPGAVIDFGTAQLTSAASKAADWVVDHKAIIIATAVGIGCTALTGAILACGALGGAIHGGFNNCGNGNTAGQCATGVIREAAEWALTDAAFLGAGKLARLGTRNLTTRLTAETGETLLTKIVAAPSIRRLAINTEHINNVRRARSFDLVDDLGHGVLGSTDKFGNITIRRGLDPTTFKETLKHETVHSVLSPTHGPLRGLRADVGIGAYNRSHLVRYLEEAGAEAYGTGSLKHGLLFPLSGAYDISAGRLVVEALGYFSAVGGTMYGTYEIVN